MHIEEIIRDPESTLKDVFQFFNLEWKSRINQRILMRMKVDNVYGGDITRNNDVLPKDIQDEIDKTMKMISKKKCKFYWC